MADIERSLLYAGTGFIFGLYLMTRMSFLRPATAKSMNQLQDYPPYTYIPDRFTRVYPPDVWIGERPS